MHFKIAASFAGRYNVRFFVTILTLFWLEPFGFVIFASVCPVIRGTAELICCTFTLYQYNTAHGRYQGSTCHQDAC